MSLEDANSSDVTFVGMSGTVEESYPKEVFPNAEVRGIVTNDVGAWIGEVASARRTPHSWIRERSACSGPRSRTWNRACEC